MRCAVDTCLRPPDAARGWCYGHYQRWYLTGDPGPADFLPVKGPHKEVVKYNGMHYRLRQRNGPASDHACVDCGSAADEWSYDNTDPDEQIEIRMWRGKPIELPYSLDPSFYVARCLSCHRTADGNRPRRVNAEAVSGSPTTSEVGGSVD